jgi:hypothetical protein
MVEEDTEILDELARNRNVTAVSADEITKAIKFCSFFFCTLAIVGPFSKFQVFPHIQK